MAGMDPDDIPFPDDDGRDRPPMAEPVFGKTIFPVTLDGVHPPDRVWAVNDWIPDSCVTGLYGDGGVGKSLLAMMLMTCVSQNIPFLGLPTRAARAFGFFCEDSQDELHRRQRDINDHYGINFSELQNMAWQSRVGCDNILMTFQNGLGKPTAAYAALRAEIIRTRSTFVVIDTAADTFGGNENARQEVRQFINLLGRLALEISGAVILCAHPSRSGLNDDSGSGGSTAWNNTLRSRLYLRRPKNGQDDMNEEEAKGVRLFSRMKSNYAEIGDSYTLKWTRGAFRVDPASAKDLVSRLEIDKKNREDDAIFVEVLDKLNEQGFTLSISPQSSTFAPRMIAKDTLAKMRGISNMRKAMDRLIAEGKICIGPLSKKQNRHARTGLTKTVRTFELNT